MIGATPLHRLLVIGLLVGGSSVIVGGCDGPQLSTTTVELAIDFTADALLEVAVFEMSAADCGAALGGNAGVEPVGVDRDGADGLDSGGEVTLNLPELPAEVPLTFYASATDAGALQAEDCIDDVIVPAGGTVEVRLVVAAP